MEYCKYCGKPLNDRLTCIASPDDIFCTWECHNEYVAYQAIHTASLAAEEISIDTLDLKPSAKCRRNIKRRRLLKKLKRSSISICTALSKLGAVVAILVFVISATCIDTEGTSLFYKLCIGSIGYMLWFILCTKAGKKIADMEDE